MALELRGTDTFRRREHVFTMFGLVVLLGIVAAASFGFLGKGPWSGQRVESEGGAVVVEHLRISHIEADDMLTLTLAPTAAEPDGENETITVDITGSWIQGINRQSVSPSPSEEVLIPGGIRMEFAFDPDAEPQSGSTDSLQVFIQFRAQELGELDGTVTVGGESASFRSFVLP